MSRATGSSVDDDGSALTEEMRTTDREEERFRALFQYASDLISVVAAEGILSYASPSHQWILGYAPSELVGQNMFDFIHPADRPGMHENLARVVREPKACAMDTFRFRHRDGSWRWLESVGRNLLDNPAVTGIVAASRDVTDRIGAEERLRESELRFKAQYKGLPIPVYSWRKAGDDFCLEDYNHAAAEITQGRVVDLLGTRLSELYSDEPDIIAEMWRCYREQRSFRREMLYHYRSVDATRLLAVSYGFVPPDLVLVHTEDVTERVEAMEALQQLRDELETRVHERTIELDRANEALSASQQQLEQLYVQLEEHSRTLEAHVAARTWEIEQRRQIAESLRDMLTILNSGLPLDEILDHIVTGASRLLGSDTSAIYRLQESDGDLQIQTVQGTTAAEISQARFPPHLATALHEGSPIAISNRLEAGGTPPAIPMACMPDCCQALLAVPLIVKGDVYGAIVLYYADPRQASEEEIDLAVAFADQAALAIESAWLRQQVRESAVSDERARLARELHDSVTQSLFSMTLLTEAALRLIRTGDTPRVNALLERLGERSQQALREMRLLVYELRPPVLEREGLAGALQRRLDAVEARAGIGARLLVDGSVLVPSDVEEALYRITEQALNNALKHAAASEVTVRLRAENRDLLLEVRDNGAGFDLAAVESGGGQGLISMRERADQIGATFTIHSKPGDGTRAVVRLPLTREERR
ncbi:MAG TPA: PAS domain S-box protein [Anaerolineae bacterium]|nr:PAS domain S-box protein [Anaerolineae bacterium]